MSVQAMAWVLEDAPDLPAHLVGTLLALANHADRNGCGSYPLQKTVAWYTRKSDRSVRNDLVQLLKLGLIREGDQRLVAHIPADERPVVYDLSLDRTRNPRDRKPTSGPSLEGTGSPLPAPHSKGPEAHFRPKGRGTGSPLPEGPEAHFLHNQLHNQLPRPPQASSTPRTAIAAALGVEEEEADRIFNRVLVERRPVAPSRYIETLIASGDIGQFRTTTRPAAPYTGTRCSYIDPGDNTGLCATCGMPTAHARHGDPS